MCRTDALVGLCLALAGVAALVVPALITASIGAIVALSLLHWLHPRPRAVAPAIIDLTDAEYLEHLLRNPERRYSHA